LRAISAILAPSAEEQWSIITRSGLIPMDSKIIWTISTCLLADRFPLSKSHSPSYHPITATPSAPLRKARNIRSADTRPVHVTRTVRNDAGYCALIVPAISSAP